MGSPLLALLERDEEAPRLPYLAGRNFEDVLELCHTGLLHLPCSSRVPTLLCLGCLIRVLTTRRGGRLFSVYLLKYRKISLHSAETFANYDDYKQLSGISCKSGKS